MRLNRILAAAAPAAQKSIDITRTARAPAASIRHFHPVSVSSPSDRSRVPSLRQGAPKTIFSNKLLKVDFCFPHTHRKLIVPLENGVEIYPASIPSPIPCICHPGVSAKKHECDDDDDDDDDDATHAATRRPKQCGQPGNWGELAIDGSFMKPPPV